MARIPFLSLPPQQRINALIDVENLIDLVASEMADNERSSIRNLIALASLGNLNVSETDLRSCLAVGLSEPDLASGRFNSLSRADLNHITEAIHNLVVAETTHLLSSRIDRQALDNAIRDILAPPSRTKTLIIGRSGSGKDYLKDKLVALGWTFVKSYTTRPQRSPNEDTHIFISKQQAREKFPDVRVAETTINGHEYFATRQQVEQCDGYIIDPRGARELMANMPGTNFDVVYIQAIDRDTRRQMAINRAQDAVSEGDIFDARDKAEDAQFKEFESKIARGERLADNCTNVRVLINDFEPSTVDKFVATLPTPRRDFSQPQHHVGQRHTVAR